MNDLVAVARLVKTRGLRGEIVADVLTDFPERFEGLKNVVAVLPGGARHDLKIERFWFQKNRIVLKFAEIDSIEAAEPLVNAEICVAESEAVELETDEYFDWQLENCAVETIEGARLGTVREVLRMGGTEILAVDAEGATGKDYLIPFAATICVEVDVEKKLIRVDAPEGLLEF